MTNAPKTAEQTATAVDLISKACVAITEMQAAIATPAADDMIYEVPKCLCIKMENGKPQAVGPRFADALPAGMTFSNGVGTRAVRVKRRDAMQRAIDGNFALIKMLSEHMAK